MANDKIAYTDVFGVTPTNQRRIGGFALKAIARFVDAGVYDQPLVATGEDGLAAVRVASAIEQSAGTGQPLDL